MSTFVLRRVPAIVLDVIAAVLAATAIWTAGGGGLSVRTSTIRLTITDPTRITLWLCLTLALRAFVAGRTGPFGASLQEWGRLVRLPLITERFEPRAAPGLWKRTFAAALGIGLALSVLLHEQILHPYSVPDLGDPLFSIWRIAWVVHALTVDPAHLFGGNIFHPFPLALTLSDPIILPAVIAAPLRAVGLHPLLAYNLLFVSAFWFSGIATYVLVERLTGSPRGAFIAGLVYATYSYRFDHYSHLELQMTYWMPLALLALHLFVSTGGWRYAIALALAGVAQLYSGMYYAVFFVVYALVVATGLCLSERPPIRSLMMPLVVGGLLAGALAVPLVRAFLSAESIKGERSMSEIRLYSATPSDYLRPNPRSAVWKDVMPPASPERALFPGAAPLALAAASLIPPLGALRLVYLASLVLAVDGSLGVNGVSYPLLHEWFPPFRGLRSPARFGALVGLSLAILSGWGATRWLRPSYSRSTGHAVFTVMILVVLIDAWPSMTLVPVWREPPPIYRSLQDTPGAVIAEFPVRGDAAYNAAFMYFSVWHWLPMVNGYSGFLPQSYSDVSSDLEEFPMGRSIAVLQRMGATHAIVNCGIRWIGLDDCATIMQRASREPELTLVAETVWEGAPVALYEVGRLAASP